MFPKHLKTKSDEDLTIREANTTDASALIEYMNQVIGESDFLTFGVGDFDKTIEEEEKIINAHSNVENKIFLVATIEEKKSVKVSRKDIDLHNNANLAAACLVQYVNTKSVT